MPLISIMWPHLIHWRLFSTTISALFHRRLNSFHCSNKYWVPSSRAPQQRLMRDVWVLLIASPKPLLNLPSSDHSPVIPPKYLPPPQVGLVWHLKMFCMVNPLVLPWHLIITAFSLWSLVSLLTKCNSPDGGLSKRLKCKSKYFVKGGWRACSNLWRHETFEDNSLSFTEERQNKTALVNQGQPAKQIRFTVIS